MEEINLVCIFSVNCCGRRSKRPELVAVGRCWFGGDVGASDDAYRGRFVADNSGSVKLQKEKRIGEEEGARLKKKVKGKETKQGRRQTGENKRN